MDTYIYRNLTKPTKSGFQTYLIFCIETTSCSKPQFDDRSAWELIGKIRILYIFALEDIRYIVDGTRRLEIDFGT